MTRLGWYSTWLLGVLLCWASNALGQPGHLVRIGLEDFAQAQTIQVQTVTGSYRWFAADGSPLGPLVGVETLQCSAQGLLALKLSEAPFTYLILQPAESSSVLRLVSSTTGYRQYQGTLHVFLHEKKIHLVLEADVESYLPGVLAAEVGKGHAPAFYQAHAIISRTYAAQARDRHRMSGFDLCDQVHCQVFEGIGTVNDTLKEACTSTQSVIVADRLGRPITTAFHSNCGGTTRTSREVWGKNLPYLQSVLDVDCLAGPHAQWARTVDRASWMAFFNRSGTAPDAAWNESERIAIRTAFDLPSSKFELKENETTPSVINLIGSGFGHGVGFCQEGAMSKAQLEGASAWSLLTAYYRDVRLVDWPADIGASQQR